MTKEIKDEATLSRRKALSRLGLIAATAYAVPAFTTLSMAHAASGSSGNSKSSGPSSDSSSPSDTSSPSEASSPSNSSSPTSATGPSSDSAAAQSACGTKNLDDSNYVQCLIDNNLRVPSS